ncbi:MAG: hypothetical protein ACLU3I_21070 [Acutalibacteraceae bacterium]
MLWAYDNRITTGTSDTDLQPGRLLHPRPDRDLPVQILSGTLNKFKRGCSEKSLQPRQLFKAPRVLNTSAYGSGVKQARICRSAAF